MTITPPPRVRAARVETYDDHRMAMSFALAATRRRDVEVADPICVNKTYPQFFADLERAAGAVSGRRAPLWGSPHHHSLTSAAGSRGACPALAGTDPAPEARGGPRGYRKVMTQAALGRLPPSPVAAGRVGSCGATARSLRVTRAPPDCGP